MAWNNWARKAAATLGSVALVTTLAACGGSGAGGGAGAGSGESTAPEDIQVGVAMPTETSERWIADGDAVKSQLEEAGYSVDLQFANDDIPTQQQQIDQMITKGADILVVASIDGTALSNQLQAAADQDIPIISYDRLINGTENVDFYVTFDNYNVGVQQATSLLTGLGLLDADGNKTDKKGPLNIELFAGSLDDNNAHFFWKGAIDTLQPYLDDKTLVVKSGQTKIEQAATLRWSQEEAQSRMEDLLTAHYAGGKTQLDGVLSPFDGISRGVITALSNAGYGKDIKAGLPVVSGQDAEIASVKLIDDGVQYSTIFKDTRKLASQAVDAVKAYAGGGEPTANDTESYNNGVKAVPSFLLESDIVIADNIQKLLVDSGYYTADEVKSGQSK
ncbi:multiple monosaccharide ABC transporter substrate-binding protein [Glutamicibacter soli]|uniref:Sugar ABC transporter substrate-binding protein n=1 Tax=Glutamicibacter soli TaxID=453836 RepID=A0A365YGI9_9MICC|nr:MULTISPECIES: multiple monosaccharide ABC transporter substrate-binding protein [Micrococcaceae]ALQ29265.1 sugar ABC transporter substrate-binding protein [Arthrobacter sp. YC-RL1]KLI89338.1 sugar ABC transporter substrate-binding protein [Arthrobacter sp. YC-RL1]RBM01124.1 sugar ABC transporter substrate-binding protein [Glutamicibacter soli]